MASRGMIRLLAGLALLALAAAAAPSQASAALSEAAVRKHLAETYGVRVLKIRRTRIDGRNAYLVTVMNPPGDYNEAFQVTILAVDAETGRLIPSFRHRTSGYDLPGAPARETNRQPPDVLRWGRDWR